MPAINQHVPKEQLSKIAVKLNNAHHILEVRMNAENAYLIHALQDNTLDKMEDAQSVVHILFQIPEIKIEERVLLQHVNKIKLLVETVHAKHAQLVKTQINSKEYVLELRVVLDQKL